MPTLADGADFLLPRRHNENDDPMITGPYEISDGDALHIEWSMTPDGQLFAGPVGANIQLFITVAAALYNIDEDKWYLMGADYSGDDRPFGHDAVVVQLYAGGPTTTVAHDSFVGAATPPPGNYMVGLYCAEVYTNGLGQIAMRSTEGWLPQLRTWKISADCVLSAYDGATLFEVTPGNPPFSNPG